MNTLDEWNILVESAKRRRVRGVPFEEDMAILELSAAWRFILGKITIAENGEISLSHEQTDYDKNLKNAIKHGVSEENSKMRSVRKQAV